MGAFENSELARFPVPRALPNQKSPLSHDSAWNLGSKLGAGLQHLDLQELVHIGILSERKNADSDPKKSRPRPFGQCLQGLAALLRLRSQRAQQLLTRSLFQTNPRGGGRIPSVEKSPRPAR